MKTTCFHPSNLNSNQSVATISKPSLRRCFVWCMNLPAALLAAAILLTGTSVRASDPVGVFGMIDKVVLEPNENTPERIQVFGAFSVADPKNRDGYVSPQ